MFLSIKKSGKGHLVYLMESFRDKDGRPKSKVIHNYGRLEELPPEKIQELKEQYGDRRLKQALENKQNKEVFDRLVKSITETGQPGARPGLYLNPLLHYGQYAVKKIWDEELNLYRKIGALQTQRTRIRSYKISSIALHLTALKIMDPCSHLHAFNAQYSFLGNFIEGIPLDNIYVALDFLGQNKDDIMKYAAKRTLAPGRRPVMLFYDVTNCYFETAYDDREHFIRKFKRRTIKKMRSEPGMADTAVEQYLKSPEFDQVLNQAIEAHKQHMLRFRGLSKEMRYDLPLISIAMIIDERGIPLDFQVYKGNESEYTTMVQSICALKKKYDVENVYIVADRGINSTSNLHMLLQEGLGFVVAQKVKYNRQIKELIEDDTGWKESSVPGGGDVFRYKIAPFIKTGVQKDPAGTKQKLFINCRIMLSFSRRRQMRDLKQLQEDKKKAEEAIAQGRLMSRYGGAGWRGLVNTILEDIDKEFGNTEKQSRASSLKENVIAEREALAGYTAVVFSPSRSDMDKGISLDEEKLLSSYRNLVRIEECFRIMKSSFSLRPMFVRTENCIVGHCLICVLALMILRLMQLRLNENETPLTVNQIISTLYNATVTAIKSGDENLMLMPCRNYDDVLSVAGGYSRYDIDALADVQDICACYLKNSRQGDTLDLIFQAIGLTPLKEICSVQEAGRKLRTKFAKKEDALGVVISNILAANNGMTAGARAEVAVM